MTEQLYLLDSHMQSFASQVTSCEQVEGGCLVAVKESCFFPTAGGQPCDHGTLGEAAVLDVSERGGELFHLCDRALPVGSSVIGRIDWARRFDFMQQHTGEHLFSYVLYADYGAANVGFHLADAYATIDMDKALTREELSSAVLKTNRLIAKNLPVTAVSFESEAALHDSGLPLRKHAEGLTPPIRIVSIEGADACTCCAPHCKFTGEIGHLLVSDAIPYKGGTRITFLCGLRATEAAMGDHALLDSIARRFSTARSEVEGAVLKQTEALSGARYQNKLLTEQLNGFLKEELLAKAALVQRQRICIQLYDGMEPQQLSALAALIAKEANCVAVLFSKSEQQTAYTLASSEGFPLDMGELCQSVNALTGGKGGGRGSRAQGMTKAAVPPEIAEQLRAYLIKRLR